MLEVVERTEEGFFDFLYRPNYYPDGLPNLNEPDKFSYEEDGQEIEAVFDLGVYVDSPTDIIEQIDIFADSLRKKTDNLLEFTSMQMRIFDE